MEQVRFRTFLRENWLLVAAIIYVLFPIDFIPDALLPVGFVDDLAVLVVTLVLRYLKSKKGMDQKPEEIMDGEVVE